MVCSSTLLLHSPRFDCYYQVITNSNMSIQPGSRGRGVAACFSQPLSADDRCEAITLEGRVECYNERVRYRQSLNEWDVQHPVYRWDTRPYDHVFTNGLRPRDRGETPESVYYNLSSYVNSGGRPLASNRRTNYAFVSTSVNVRWFPAVRDGTTMQVYRYEIYAPGGISVAVTLGRSYPYREQDEVAFPLGIAPQYIRSARLFEFRRDSTTGGSTTRTPVEGDILHMNSNFNPQSHPLREIAIERPLKEYEVIENGRKITRKFKEKKFPERSKRAIDASDMYDYYAEEVTNVKSYIDSAFCSKTRKYEAYLFMKNEYVLIDYAPGSTNDRLIQGPKYIVDSFPSLAGTVFGEYGIDAAFGGHDSGLFYTNTHAFIFCGNLCARINYAPGTTDDKILEGPITISEMFSGFEGTSFAEGIDAAFESTTDNEAYLFKGSQYALIDYGKREKMAIRYISEGFPNFVRDCYSFTRKVGAAFTSHNWNEAYWFKDDQYVLVEFTPGKTGDRVIGGPKNIVPYNWPSLKNVLPRRNIGVDIDYVTSKPKPDRKHDEL